MCPAQSTTRNKYITEYIKECLKEDKMRVVYDMTFTCADFKTIDVGKEFYKCMSLIHVVEMLR